MLLIGCKQKATQKSPLCSHDIMPVTDNVQSSMWTCLCQYEYRDSSKVNLWIFKHNADVHKKMKHVSLKRRPGTGQQDERGRSMAPIVMQNVQSEQFQTDFAGNTIKSQRINRHLKVGCRQKNLRGHKNKNKKGTEGGGQTAITIWILDWKICGVSVFVCVWFFV